MTKATRIINKYHIKEMLLNGNPQFENFYKEELIQFCEVAKELSKQYQREHQELNEELAIYKNVILANNDIPNLEDFLNKPINPDLSNWSICDIQYIKGYLYALSLREQELKKQLEEKEILIKQYDLSVSNMMDCYCERTDCSGRIKDSKVYDSLVQKVETQQQEFIKYLKDMIVKEKEELETVIELMKLPKEDLKYNGTYKFCISFITKLEEILQKYKEIIGMENE